MNNDRQNLLNKPSNSSSGRIRVKSIPLTLWGLSTHAADNMKTLKETMKVLGHDKLDAVDVFKIDCENVRGKRSMKIG
jgi:hypothetical protein